MAHSVSGTDKTLSAPNPISTVYKNLIFTSNVSPTAAAVLNFTAADGYDIQIVELGNNFDFVNSIIISGDLSGKPALELGSEEQGISVSQLINDMYRGSEQSLDPDHFYTVAGASNDADASQGPVANEESVGVVAGLKNEAYYRHLRDGEQNTEINSIQSFIGGANVSGWNHVTWADSYLYEDLMPGSTVYINGTITDNIVDALATIDTQLLKHNVLLQGLWNEISGTYAIASGTDLADPVTATSFATHNALFEIGHPTEGSGDTNYLAVQDRWLKGRPGDVTPNTAGQTDIQVTGPGGSTSGILKADSSRDGLNKLDQELAANELWTHKLNYYIDSSNYDNLTGSDVVGSGVGGVNWTHSDDNWSAQLDALSTSGDYTYTRDYGDNDSTSMLDALKNMDMWMRYLERKIDRNYQNGGTLVGAVADNTNRRSLVELNADIDSLCAAVIGTDVANTNAGVPTYTSTTGNTYANESTLRADIDKLDAHVQQLTLNIHDADTEGITWASTIMSEAVTAGASGHSSIKEDIAYIHIELDTLEANMGTSSLGVYTSDNNIYATTDFVKNDIEELDQRLEDTTRDLYNGTGVVDWTTGEANIAYGSSAMTDIQGIRYVLGIMQDNIGLTGAELVTSDGVYTSQNNIYATNSIIKNDIESLDQRLEDTTRDLYDGNAITAWATGEANVAYGSSAMTDIQGLRWTLGIMQANLGVTGADAVGDGVYTSDAANVYGTGNVIKTDITSLDAEVQAIKTILTGGPQAGDTYTTAGTTGDNVEMNIVNIQTEIDAIEAAVGLSVVGAYTTPTGNYLGNSNLRADLDELDQQVAHLTNSVFGNMNAGDNWSTGLGTADAHADIEWLHDEVYSNTYSLRNRIDTIVRSDNGVLQAATDLDMDSHRILNVTTPSDASHGANKSYVDSTVQGFSPQYNVKVATAKIADASSLTSDSPSQNGADPVGGLMAIDTSHTKAKYEEPLPKQWTNKGNIYLTDTSLGSVQYEHGGIAYDDTTKAPKTITANTVYIDGISVQTGDLILVTSESLAEVDGSVWRESTAPGEEAWHWRNGVWKFNESTDNGGIWERPTTGIMWNASGTKDVAIGTYHPIKEGYHNNLTVFQAIEATVGAGAPDYPMQSCATEAVALLVSGGPDSSSAWTQFQGLSTPSSGNVTSLINTSEVWLDYNTQQFQVAAGSPDYLDIKLEATGVSGQTLTVPFNENVSGLSLKMDTDFFTWDASDSRVTMSSTAPVNAASLVVDAANAVLVANNTSNVGQVGINKTDPTVSLEIGTSNGADGKLKTASDADFGGNVTAAGNMNVASGKVYKVNGTEVMSATSLATAVQVPVDSLNSGTSAGVTSFWRGDGTWYNPRFNTSADSGTSDTIYVGSGDTLNFDGGTDLASVVNGNTITFNHSNVTNTPTASTSTAVAGGTQTVVDSITASARGHITAVNTKTITFPAEYVHPTHLGNDISLDTGALTGATVISDLDFHVTTDTKGHVTAAAGVETTRELTPADIGVVTTSDSVTDGTTTFSKYTHPNITSGGGHLPTGTATSGMFLKYSSNGVGTWATPAYISYLVGDGGLTQKNFTSTLKTKLDGIEASATADQTGPQILALFSNSITAGHIAANAIGTSELASNSVDSTHYVDGSIDNAHIADNAINSEHYYAGSIDNEHIADNAINSEHYADASIDRAHLSADIIDGTKIANDAIDSEHYASNSIDALHLNVSGNGSSAQYLRSDGDGTMTWATPTNTQYTDGTGINQSGTIFSITPAQTAITSIYNTSLKIGYSSGDDNIDFANNQLTFTVGGVSTIKMKASGEIESTSIDTDSINVSGTSYLYGDVYLGNTASDDIYNLGDFKYDITPNADGVHLGSGAQPWRDIYSDRIQIKADAPDATLTSENTEFTVNSSGHLYFRTPGDTSGGWPIAWFHHTYNRTDADNGNATHNKDVVLISSTATNTGNLHCTVNNRFLRFRRNDPDGSVQGGTSTDIGGVSGNGAGGVDFDETFTGSHSSVIAKSDIYDLGMIVESTGAVWAKMPDNQHMSTGLPKLTVSNTDASKTVYGVVNKLESSLVGYAQAWVVDSDENHIEVNSLGEGLVWVTNKDGDISNGDYITSSVVSGYGTKQADDILRSCTVAKCTENIDWDNVSDTIDHAGVSYKKYVTMCTYHCG